MPGNDLALHAWGDESARTVGVARPTYMLGAVVTDPQICPGIREELRALHGAPTKLHWRGLDRRRRTRVVELLSGLDAYHLVVAGAPLESRKPERARAHCLERLLWELGEQHHVDRLVLEARPATLMQRDRRTVDGLRGRGALPRGIRMEHGEPNDEPMLWIADQVLGAFGDHLRGDDAWFGVIRGSVQVVQLAL